MRKMLVYYAMLCCVKKSCVELKRRFDDGRSKIASSVNRHFFFCYIINHDVAFGEQERWLRCSGAQYRLRRGDGKREVGEECVLCDSALGGRTPQPITTIVSIETSEPGCL
jgi:hypothetical protein